MCLAFPPSRVTGGKGARRRPDLELDLELGELARLRARWRDDAQVAGGGAHTVASRDGQLQRLADPPVVRERHPHCDIHGGGGGWSLRAMRRTARRRAHASLPEARGEVSGAGEGGCCCSSVASSPATCVCWSRQYATSLCRSAFTTVDARVPLL